MGVGIHVFTYVINNDTLDEGNNMSKRKEKNKILFVYSSLPSFVRRDLEILERHFTVKKVKIRTFRVTRKGSEPLVFLRLLKGVLWADFVYTWFARWSAFFIVLFCMFLRKKCIIVVGGYDVVYIPEIDYGSLKSLLGSLKVKFILEHATKILPFSNYANNRVLSVTKKANICVIPLGCDTEKFKPVHSKKENLVVTVCHITRNNVARKGLKTFIKSAMLLPNVKFALIGRYRDDSVYYLKKIAPPNVEFTGYVSDEELVKWYQRAKVYCQLSYEEGFGVALVEAMACECVPVASLKAKVLRETVGNCGFYVPYGNVKATVKAIKKASSSPQDMGVKARARVENLFTIEKREKRLLRAINDMIYTHK